MTYLDVPGARLYYELHGDGPLLVMIPGASGVADTFRMVVEHLAARYTVLIYDRRGFSRSQLDGPQDYDHRLETEADDVRRLIEHVSDEPAAVFGASSGAIVALTLLTRHPSVVRTLVPFEPPAMLQLPDGQQWVDFFAGVYDRYRQSGVEAALAEFRERSFPPADRQAMTRAPRHEGNAVHWFEHELRQYPAVSLDLDALSGHADRIVPAVGRETRDYPVHQVNVELGKKLGRKVIELPGGHVGVITHPAEFARELVEALNVQRWEDSYAVSPHWDIGRPQSALRALADAGAISGRVLDVGCGTGEHALMAASLGLDVTGVDFASEPLRIAEWKARDRGVTARFVVHDARKLPELGESFDTVLDCGLFHILDDGDRVAYVDSVRRALVPGGRYFMVCFSDRQPGEEGPRRLSEDEIRTSFAAGWRVDSIEPTTLDTPAGSADIQGWLVALTAV